MQTLYNNSSSSSNHKSRRNSSSSSSSCIQTGITWQSRCCWLVCTADCVSTVAQSACVLYDSTESRSLIHSLKFTLPNSAANCCAVNCSSSSSASRSGGFDLYGNCCTYKCISAHSPPPGCVGDTFFSLENFLLFTRPWWQLATIFQFCLFAFSPMGSILRIKNQVLQANSRVE